MDSSVDLPDPLVPTRAIIAPGGNCMVTWRNRNRPRSNACPTSSSSTRTCRFHRYRVAHGQTYGVANDNGTPDLIAAIATNGKSGYVYARDLEQPAPTTLQFGTPPGQTRTIPVYTSDGHTEIGQFLISSQADEADTR